MARKKTFTEMLETPVSLGMFKELKDFLGDIPLPFGRNERSPAQQEIADKIAVQTGAKDLEAVLEQLQKRGRAIGEILTEKGIVNSEQLRAVAEEQQRRKVSWTQALANLGLVSSSNIHNIAHVLMRELEEKEKGKSLDMLLVSKGLITKERMAEIKRLAKERAADLAQTVLSERALSLAQLGEVFRDHYQIDCVDVAQARVEPAAVRMIPDPIMREQRILAYELSNGGLKVAMADPRNDNLRDRLQIMTGKTILPLLAEETAILSAQRRYAMDAAPGIGGGMARPQDLEELAGRETTVRMVEQILESAIRGQATDIHLEPQANHLRVRFRIDGMLHDFMTLPVDAGTPVLSRLKILSNMDITERRRPQDGRMTSTVGERIYHFRASTLPTTMGEKLALRILPDASLMMGMQELGLQADGQEKLDRALARTHGMILVTGPIGSGKTTTLYNMLQTKNRQSTNIVTIEDPVEYQLPGINQIAVDPKLGLDFASGLRAILRQDANVLMVGEIRDSETAQTAVRAALTGHLLFSTLHTHDTVGAIHALRHLGIPPFLIASSLVCVIAQRLLRRVCPHCARMVAPPATLRGLLALSAKSKKKIPEAVGCDRCFRTGYLGRVGVFDVLLLNDQIRDVIAAGAPESEVRAHAQKLGSQGLLAQGWNKVAEGATTPEEVLRVLCSDEN